jgi:hypothetical protein
MPPASAFRHLTPQSGTEALRYRSGSPYSVPDRFRHRHFFIPVLDCPDARQTVIPAFAKTVRRKKGVHPARPQLLYTADGGEGSTLHDSARPFTAADDVKLALLNLLYDVANAGMPRNNYFGTGICSGSQLRQSGTGIPAPGSVRYHWPTG